MDSMPKSEHDTTEAFRIMCGLCARLFEESPDAEFIAGLIENRSLLLEPPFSTVANEASQALYDVLDAVDHESTAELETLIANVHRDYTYLFYMVGSSHTSPYESVYRTDDRTLFGPTTLEVRKLYRARDVQATGEGSRPDDHIANEFAFLELLCGLDVSENDIRSFLSDHILVFAPVYLKNVQTRALEPFYRSAAGLAEALLAAMALSYGAAPTEVLDERAYLLGGNTL